MGRNDELAGDRVRLTVERRGESQEITMLLRPPVFFPLAGQSARRSGFPQAFGVMVGPGEPPLGGAVVSAVPRSLQIVQVQAHEKPVKAPEPSEAQR
jgi:hypothetical protein